MRGILDIFKKEKKAAVPECQHEQKVRYFDINREKVLIRCLDCKEVLASFDPEAQEEKQRHNPYNRKLYVALTRRRRGRGNE